PGPPGVGRRLRFGDASLVDEGRDGGVVVGEALQLAVTQPVGPRVAEVQGPDPGAVDQQRDDGGAGPPQVRVLPGEVGEPDRRVLDRLAQGGEQVDAGEV